MEKSKSQLKPVQARNGSKSSVPTSPVVVTSESKPMKASWMWSQDGSLPKGRLGLTHAPGKVIPMGRDRKSYARNIHTDVGQYAAQGIKLVVCLLNQYELRTLGVDLVTYRSACEKAGLRLLLYPIVENSVPETVEDFHENVVNPILETVVNRAENCVAHCRGGIGRAGTLASCILLALGIEKRTTAAVREVRARRDRRCVESRRQHDFIKAYRRYLISMNAQKEDQETPVPHPPM